MISIGLFFAIAATILWGLNYTLDGMILQAVSPAVVLLFYSLVGVLLSSLILLFDRDAWTQLTETTNSTRVLLGISMVVATFANLMILSSVKNLGATPAAMIEISYPIFVVLFSFLLLGERPSLQVLGGGVLIFIGVYIIARTT